MIADAELNLDLSDSSLLKTIQRGSSYSVASTPTSNMPFTATTTGPDTLGLRAILEDFARRQWIPDHLDDRQRADWVLDQFRRTVMGEMEMLVVE